jgi:hypothetical protein
LQWWLIWSCDLSVIFTSKVTQKTEVYVALQFYEIVSIKSVFLRRAMFNQIHRSLPTGCDLKKKLCQGWANISPAACIWVESGVARAERRRADSPDSLLSSFSGVRATSRSLSLVCRRTTLARWVSRSDWRAGWGPAGLLSLAPRWSAGCVYGQAREAECCGAASAAERAPPLALYFSLVRSLYQPP